MPKNKMKGNDKNVQIIYVRHKVTEVWADDDALKTFYAMTLYNLGQHSLSIEILLNILADTSLDLNIKEYSKAIRFYSGNLDKVWWKML